MLWCRLDDVGGRGSGFGALFKAEEEGWGWGVVKSVKKLKLHVSPKEKLKEELGSGFTCEKMLAVEGEASKELKKASVLRNSQLADNGPRGESDCFCIEGSEHEEKDPGKAESSELEGDPQFVVDVIPDPDEILIT